MLILTARCYKKATQDDDCCHKQCKHFHILADIIYKAQSKKHTKVCTNCYTVAAFTWELPDVATKTYSLGKCYT